MKQRHRLSRADYLRFTLPRVLTFVFGLGLVLAFGWFTAQSKNLHVERCTRLYAAAATPADSARVDAVRVRSPRYNKNSCGEMKRRGFLGQAPRPSPGP